MFLKFYKENDNNISVKFSIDGKEEDFNYIKMIDLLYNKNKFDAPKFCDGISVNEQEKLIAMIDRINDSIVKKEDEGVATKRRRSPKI